MTPQNQLNKRDCLRAGIASLLGLKVSEVPDFMEGDNFENLEDAPNGTQYPSWYLKTQAWLALRGLCYVEVATPNGLRTINSLPFPSFALIVGKRGGTRHVVVGRVNEGVEWLHDPLGDDKGLDELGAIAYLVPLDCEQFVKHAVALECILKLAESPVGGLKSEVIAICKEALGKPTLELIKP